MDTAQLAGIIITVGALLPLATSIVEQQSWSTRTRTVVGVVMAVLAGLVTYITQFGLDFSNPAALTTTIVGILLASGAAYKTVWQPSGIAPALEGKTSPRRALADPEAAEGDEEDEPEIDIVDADDVPEAEPIENMGQPYDFDDGSDPAKVG